MREYIVNAWKFLTHKAQVEHMNYCSNNRCQVVTNATTQRQVFMLVIYKRVVINFLVFMFVPFKDFMHSNEYLCWKSRL